MRAGLGMILCPFRGSMYTVRGRRREIEHILREQMGQVIDDIPHGNDTDWPALIVENGNVPVAADAHLV